MRKWTKYIKEKWVHARLVQMNYFIGKSILQQKQSLNLYYHIAQEFDLEANSFL